MPIITHGKSNNIRIVINYINNQQPVVLYARSGFDGDYQRAEATALALLAGIDDVDNVQIVDYDGAVIVKHRNF